MIYVILFLFALAYLLTGCCCSIYERASLPESATPFPAALWALLWPVMLFVALMVVIVGKLDHSVTDIARWLKQKHRK